VKSSHAAALFCYLDHPEKPASLAKAHSLMSDPPFLAVTLVTSETPAQY